MVGRGRPRWGVHLQTPAANLAKRQLQEKGGAQSPRRAQPRHCGFVLRALAARKLLQVPGLTCRIAATNSVLRSSRSETVERCSHIAGLCRHSISNLRQRRIHSRAQRAICCAAACITEAAVPRRGPGRTETGLSPLTVQAFETRNNAEVPRR